MDITAKNKRYIGSRSNIRQVFIDRVVDWNMIATKYRALVGDLEEIASITGSIHSIDEDGNQDAGGVSGGGGHVSSGSHGGNHIDV